MRSTNNPPPSSTASRAASTSHSNSTGNSGSQYALCALGVGLLALGVVMIVWSVVPPDPALNGSSGPKPDNRSRASSVAFVLVGAGVAMLLLSLCLGMRNRKRELQALQAAQEGGGAGGEAAGEDGETAEARAQRYNVPSYEEAVGSGQYPVRQSNLRHSTSQLPSYDDLDHVDAIQFETERTEGPLPSEANPAASGPAAAPANRRPGKNSRKLLPLKVRRIKSEKLHMKGTDVSLPPDGVSIEPLTPPPQYEDKVPPL